MHTLLKQHNLTALRHPRFDVVISSRDCCTMSDPNRTKMVIAIRLDPNTYYLLHKNDLPGHCTAVCWQKKGMYAICSLSLVINIRYKGQTNRAFPELHPFNLVIHFLATQEHKCTKVCCYKYCVHGNWYFCSLTKFEMYYIQVPHCWCVALKVFHFIPIRVQWNLSITTT